MIQGNLGLTVREPENVRPSQVTKLNYRTISKWIETLPVANISDSSRRLYAMLLDCNKSAMDDDERFKIMMELHTPIQLVLKSLSRHFTGHTLNLTDKQKKISALVQAIHTEMAIGFKTIIEHQAPSPGLLKKNMLHASLFMALEYLALTVVRCYQVYTDIPARLWREMNILFKYSIENKLTSRTVTIEGFNQEHSIEDAFRKVCLLSIANPYQLRQQEIEMIFTGLQRYVGLCSLEHSSRFDNRFIIDLNQSAPPMHQALVKTRPSQFTFALNLDKVVAELQKNLTEQKPEIKENIAIGGLSVRLIRHLIKSWAHLSSRNFARTPCEGRLRVSVGLSATYQILHGLHDDEPVETLETYEGSLSSATLVADEKTAELLNSFGNQSMFNGPEKEDVWAKLYRPKQAMPVNEEIDYAKSFGSSTSSQVNFKHQYELFDAEIVNISPGGYCIAFNGVPPQHTQTGEVIGLIEYDDYGNETWHIGVIRWIKRSKQSPDVQLGIQLIAPGAKPVQSKLSQGKVQGSNFQSALLLPELKGIGQPATLLTNPVLFSPKQKIIVVDGDDVFEVKLTKMVSSSQGYRQFHFERLQSDVPLANSTKNPSNDGFDNVWDLI